MEEQVYVEFTGTIRPTSKDCKSGRVLDEEVRRITGASVSMCGSPSRSFDDAMYALNNVVGYMFGEHPANESQLICNQRGWRCVLYKLDIVNRRFKVKSHLQVLAKTGPHAICKAILKLNERIESGGW